MDFDVATGEAGMTVFGQVVEGLDVLDAIGALTSGTQTDADGTELTSFPTPTVVITKALLNGTPSANAGPDQIVSQNQTAAIA